MLHRRPSLDFHNWARSESLVLLASGLDLSLNEGNDEVTINPGNYFESLFILKIFLSSYTTQKFSKIILFTGLLK